jgi:Undecaprenyl-phosphate glucose phosphotransferase
MARVQLQLVPDANAFAAAARRRPALRPARGRLGPFGFGCLAAFVDAAAIVTSAIASAALYGAAFGGGLAGMRTGFDVGLFVAVLVVFVGVHNGGYATTKYAEAAGQFSRAFPLWNVSVMAALAFGVATREIAEFPRAGLALFYVLGIVALVFFRRATTDALAAMQARGWVARRRVAVVGFEDEIEALRMPDVAVAEGAEFVCRFALRETDASVFEDLALAVAAIRLRRADDVFVALPWSRPDLVDSCVVALAKLPVEVHLGLAGALRTLRRAEVAHAGPVAGLTLTHRPLGRLQQLEKRVFDLVVAGAALTLLAPLFLALALAIRLESSGPALFRQKRYGLNQEPFRIFKFRSMRAMDDGRVVKQATRGDARVTRLGYWLRRLSIDELPQLFNVLLGDMSIVGPRPHALAHDQLYVDRLAAYARRHNVKPGITGWAQVRGHRGEIVDDGAMLQRLEHDLYYVDNWSLLLDVKIMWLTVFSRATHEKAY